MLKEQPPTEQQDQIGVYKNIPDDLLRELIGFGITIVELKKIDNLQVGEKINGQIGIMEWSVVKEKDNTYTFYTAAGCFDGSI